MRMGAWDYKVCQASQRQPVKGPEDSVEGPESMK